MRKLIVAEHISLDGIMQGPGGPKEDPSGDFRLGGSTVPYTDVLARGKRLFDDNAQASAFTLADSTTTNSGVLITRYVRSGEVRTGTFEEVE